MEIINDIKLMQGRFSRVCVALGTFDGVHVGHREIIAQAVEQARSVAGTSVVFTFTNHPLSVLDPSRCPPQIATLEEKTEVLRELGVDVLLAIPFTAAFLKLSPQQFIALLVENLQPTNIVVGPNYSFGYRSSGNPDFLAEAGEKYGFAVAIHPGVHIDEQIVSSTLIRRLILEGNVEAAARFLGRSVSVRGTVVHGKKRGAKLLGFPTANLAVAPQRVLPEKGVYVTVIVIGAAVYHSVTNIGLNPTFEDGDQTIETHIFDFKGNLYGRIVDVKFLKRLRSEQRFESLDELKRQIGDDALAAREFFSKHKI